MLSSNANGSAIDALVWSSAQPHSVAAMVNVVFGAHSRNLVGVWNRTMMGLSAREYHSKTPTTKDLSKVWNVFPWHSAETTVLVDDSEDKARLQSSNHIGVPDYTFASRARDLQLFKDAKDSMHNLDPFSGDSQYDSVLVALVGNLDEMRYVDDVASWLQGGGLRVTGGEGTSDYSSEIAPSNVELSVRSDETDGPAKWFDQPGVLDHWTRKGRAVLQLLGIPLIHGLSK